MGWAQGVGRYHEVCEDVLGYRRHGGGIRLALADGVGGGVGAAAAARAIVRRLLGAAPEAAQHIARTLAKAEDDIQRDPERQGPGAATLAAAWLDRRGRGLVTRIGDARIYHVQSERLTALLADQTYAWANEPPPSHAGPDDPARMVGTGCIGQVEAPELTLAAGEGLLLCSDGLHRALDAALAAQLLAAGHAPEHVAFALASAARAAGSEDDISVLIALYRPRPRVRPVFVYALALAALFAGIHIYW